MKDKQFYTRAINIALRSVYSAFHETVKRRKAGVIAMRAWWILPNRDQRDEILASDGKTILPLRQIIDPKLRPEGFSHGVPTELLEKCGPKVFKEILFCATVSRLEWRQADLFRIDNCGIDSSDEWFTSGSCSFSNRMNARDSSCPYAGLPEEDRPYARALVHRLTSSGPGDVWAQMLRDLGELPSGSGPATNVALDRSVVRFNSLYVVGPGGSIRKAALRRLQMTAIVLLILFAVIGGWISVHACEHPRGPQSGQE